MKRFSIVLLLCFSNLIATTQTIKSKWFTLIFSTSDRRISVLKTNGDTLLSGAVNAVFSEGKLHLSDHKNYRFTVKQAFGNNGDQAMLISARDINNKFSFNQQITLFGNVPAIGFEVKYKNMSNKEIGVQSIEPLRLVASKNGKLFFNNAEKCLTNGAMYYDAGNIQDLKKPWIRPKPYGETKGGIMLDTLLTGNPMTVQSWWNISLFSSTESWSLTAGYLLNANSMGRLQLLKCDKKQLSLVAESVLNPGFVLKPGQEISSDHLVLVTGKNLYEANECYAGLMKEKMNNPECRLVNGWCNWFYTMDVFSENEILENAAFSAEHLKPFGLEYIQIDEGFQDTHGNWQGNQHFPHGLKWLCDSIKNLGLKPGIWIAPFVISENSKVFKDHRHWLLNDENGEPKRIGPWPSENSDWYRNEMPKRYCLDLTHPEAEKWYTNLIDTIANRWGFEMIKVDFVAWNVFSATRFYNPEATPAQVYRRALEIMRQVAGEECHILDCGPGHVSGGYINSMRIEYDQNYGFADNVWTQYFRGSSCSAGAAGKRWFFHNKVWTNDIDHVCLDLLTEQEAQAAATLIGISGGNVMSGDRLMNLGEAKLAILKKIFPATPENGTPVDLAENDPQTLFTCKIKRPFGSWQLVAIFNTDKENPLQKAIPVERLQPDPAISYLAFNFWNQRFAGEITDTLKVTLSPGSTALLSLRGKTGKPQIIGTSRHIKTGAVELTAEKFDNLSKILSATSVGPKGSSHSVYVYLPDNFEWQPRNSRIYEYNINYTIRQTEPNLLRVDLHFDKTQQVDWQLRFQQN